MGLGFDESAALKEALNRMPSVSADLAQQRWANVTTSMEGHCRGSTVWVTIEPVRPFARSAIKSKCQQDAFDLGCGENRYSGPHRSGHHQRCGGDELALGIQGVLRLQKFDHFCKVVAHLFNGLTLCVCAWNTRDTTHQQARLQVALYDCVEVHALKDTPLQRTCHAVC